MNDPALRRWALAGLAGLGVQTIPGWATAVSPGPADESDQMLEFVVTGNSVPGLFVVLPEIDPVTGTLTFTPASDASGTAMIEVVLIAGTFFGGSAVWSAWALLRKDD